MSVEIKSLKHGQRVKIRSAPNEAPHPLDWQIGTVQGVCQVRKNREGVVIYKSYDVSFGHSSIREVEAKYLFTTGGE